MNASTSTSEFPIHIPRNRGRLDMNSLGLGRDSAILNAMYNSGIIASRSWSVLGGLTGADLADQIDGHLVLGGYDGAKFTGDNCTEKIAGNPTCSTNMVATVQDVDKKTTCLCWGEFQNLHLPTRQLRH